jgi:hypothetical protein
VANVSGEQCDGTDLKGKTCAYFGLDGGGLDCYPQGHDKECTFDTSDCGGGNPVDFLIGNCTYGVDGTNECDEEPIGFYTSSWSGMWNWLHDGWDDPNGQSNCETANGVGTCVQDGSTWYYDPEGDSTACEDGGSTTIECPAEIPLPFFDNFSFIISLLAVMSIYGLIHINSNRRK